MDLNEVKLLVGLLRELGVTHYKNGDVEITLSQQVAPQKGSKPKSLATPPTESEKEPPHIVHEMKAVMSMKDEELIDKLFPISPVEETA